MFACSFSRTHVYACTEAAPMRERGMAAPASSAASTLAARTPLCHRCMCSSCWLGACRSRALLCLLRLLAPHLQHIGHEGLGPHATWRVDNVGNHGREAGGKGLCDDGACKRGNTAAAPGSVRPMKRTRTHVAVLAPACMAGHALPWHAGGRHLCRDQSSTRVCSSSIQHALDVRMAA